jgi:hypothetical protein
MAATMLVIGATVVATASLPSLAAVSPSPQPAAGSAAAAAAQRTAVRLPRSMQRRAYSYREELALDNSRQ